MQYTTGSICWWARGVKGQVGGSIPTGNNPPSMNGRRRVMGCGALGCSNLTASGTRGGVARDVTWMAYTGLQLGCYLLKRRKRWTKLPM